jgi:hypothetical protein
VCGLCSPHSLVWGVKRPLLSYVRLYGVVLKDTIKIDLKEIEWEVVYWIHLGRAGDQPDFSNMVTNRGVP